MEVDLILNSDINEGTTVLNGETYNIYDNGGPDANYTDNETNSHVLSFEQKYMAVIFLDSEIGFDSLGIFNNTYSNMNFNNGIDSKFTSNGGGIPQEDIIYVQNGKRLDILTFEPNTTVTLAFGSDIDTNSTGFHLILIPGDKIHDVSFQGSVIDGSDFSDLIFENCDFSDSVWNNITINENTSFDEACQFAGANAQNINGITDKLSSFLTLKDGHLFGEGLSQKGKHFGAVDLRGINFKNNDLRGTNFSRATLGNNSSGGITVGDVFSLLETIESGEFNDDGNVETTYNYFGVSVALSSDGDVLVVGNARTTTTEAYDGKAKVFELKENSWIQKGDDIIISEPVFFADQFGHSVSISADGNIVAIGGIQYGSQKGFACIYEFVDNTWNKLGDTIEGEALADQFGYSVSLSRNATRVSIGAVQNDGNTGNNIGHIRVYEYQNNVWTQIGDDIDGINDEENFGFITSLSSDGRTVLGTTSNRKLGVRVYEEIDGEWIQKGSTLEKSGRAKLSGDGNLLVVDNDVDNDPELNAVQVYEFDGTEWIQKGSTIPTVDNNTLWSVSLTEDGSQFLYSMYANSTAEVYEWDGSDWKRVLDPIVTSIPPLKTDLSDDGKILAFGNYDHKKVETYIKNGTKLPEGFSISNGYLIKEALSNPNLPEGFYTIEAAPELSDASQRTDYLLAVKASLPAETKIVVPTAALGDEFLPEEREWTEVAYGDDTLSHGVKRNFYAALLSDEKITIEIPDAEANTTVTRKDGHHLIEHDGTQKKLNDGENFMHKDIIALQSGSLMAYYLPIPEEEEVPEEEDIPEDIICFDGSEVVETDQGSLSIQDIDPTIHTIRDQPIHKLSRTRCKETKMVSIKKNSLGQNIPNKDTLVTMNHQIFYNEKMVPARVLTRKHGVSFVESNNQVVYNVMLPTHSHMSVNNMIVETLHPKHI